jgi:hypothetical protein
MAEILWAHWAMEEATSMDRLDSSGNGHTLVLTDEGPGQTVPRIPGYLNYAAQFYGSAYLNCTTGLTVPWVDVPFRVTFYEQMVWGTAATGGLSLYISSQKASGEPPDPGLTIILTLLWDGDSYADTITVDVYLNNYNLYATFTIPTDFNWHYFDVYSTTGTNLIIEVDSAVMYQNNSCVLGLILSETFTITGHGLMTDPADNAVGVDEVYIWRITSMSHPTPPTTLLSRKTLVQAKDLMEGRHGWFYDTYTPGVLCHYGEEGADQHAILCGADDGAIYQLTGTSDGGVGIPCRVITGSENQGDPRYNKLYGDVMLDCFTNGVDVVATPLFNDDSITGTATTVNNAVRTQVPLPVGSEWQTAKNVSLDITWTTALPAAAGFAPSYLYIWEPRFTEEGGKLAAYSWETCFLTHEIDGYFYHGYLYLVHISTADLTFNIIDESTTIMASVTIPNSSGLHAKSFIRLPVVKGKLFKYHLSSTAEFRVEGQESELLVKGWGSGGPWKHERIFQDVPSGSAA